MNCSIQYIVPPRSNCCDVRSIFLRQGGGDANTLQRATRPCSLQCVNVNVNTPSTTQTQLHLARNCWI